MSLLNEMKDEGDRLVSAVKVSGYRLNDLIDINNRIEKYVKKVVNCVDYLIVYLTRRVLLSTIRNLFRDMYHDISISMYRRSDIRSDIREIQSMDNLKHQTHIARENFKEKRTKEILFKQSLVSLQHLLYDTWEIHKETFEKLFGIVKFEEFCSRCMLGLTSKDPFSLKNDLEKCEKTLNDLKVEVLLVEKEYLEKVKLLKYLKELKLDMKVPENFKPLKTLLTKYERFYNFVFGVLDKIDENNVFIEDVQRVLEYSSTIKNKREDSQINKTVRRLTKTLRYVVLLSSNQLPIELSLDNIKVIKCALRA